MPAEVSKKDRRTFRRAATEDDGLSQRERELRRARGEMSCAECNRLKLRCDRMVPCSSCVRRGRPSICPNGISGAGQEDRARFPDSMQLRQKIVEMGDRIRQLEDALEVLQKAHSNLPHSLLQKDLLEIKRGFDVSYLSEHQEPSRDADDLNAFGTLTISESGASRFHGRSGGPESLLLTGEDDPLENEQSSQPLPLPPHISQIANAWPFTAVDIPSHDILTYIESHLPPWERASSLSETYLEHISWLLRPILREQLVNELLPIVYKRKSKAAVGVGTLDHDLHADGASADELALLLMVFAVGALADLTLPPYNKEAEQYHQLARAAMSLAKVFESPSLAAVQALSLMGAYGALSGRNSSLDPAWSMISLACTLAKSMGLHRDPARWKLDPQIVDRRRNAFWELFMMENMHGLACGRPSSFISKHGDCQFPQDSESRIDENGNVEPGFWRWKFRYGKEVLYALTDVMSEVGPTKYSEILKLDRKAREVLAVPSYMQDPLGGSDWDKSSPALFLRRFMASVLRDITMMHIHRSFFAKALLDHPVNPLRSQYAHSFLSAYASSLSVLKALRTCFDVYPDLVSRFWSTWLHAFSATIVVGSVVVRGPNSDMAPTALAELNLGVELFEKAMLKSDRAKRALPILLRLRDKAYLAYSQYRRGQTSLVKGTIFSNAAQEDDWEDELDIFGGGTRLVATKDSPKPSTRSPSTADVSTPQCDASPPHEDIAAQVFAQTASTYGLQQAMDQDTLLRTYLASNLDVSLTPAAPVPDNPTLVAYTWADSLAPSWRDSLSPFAPVSESSDHIHIQAQGTSATPLEAPYAGAYSSVNTPQPEAPLYPAAFATGQIYPAAPSDHDYHSVLSSNPGLDESWRSLMQESDRLLTL